ncbi:sorting nexin-27 [Eurytemora carolleeae]|uniref:sorting nexin-27 n=1 Tax=Eurytemora carolleeae TaxID=1294199 RepID=UPI000C7732A7|nr:sorting nexin-27 [Eurytemora carolleeae]|eukprot:XP_023329887.1 sorting nexin-27-like [Eurytemora affinis]
MSEIGEGGNLKSVNGELYAPLQHVSAILPGGADDKAGVNIFYKCLEVNGTSVEGASHKQVVELIKVSGDTLNLCVVSVSEDEADRNRFDNSEGKLGLQFVDYSEKRSLPITIPDYRHIHQDGESYVVFNINMAGRHLCSRRYREFVEIHSALKTEFLGYNFPKLPGKWPFNLSDQQLDSRRRGLELYLERVCAVKVIGESDLMKEFLTETDKTGTATTSVDIKVLVLNDELVTLTIRRNTTAMEVFNLVCQEIGLRPENMIFFSLFEILDQNFERKIQNNEFPHSLYMSNYSTAAATCIRLKRWLFSLDLEPKICQDKIAEKIFFFDAILAVNRGQIVLKENSFHLKSLQDSFKISEYLSIVRECDGYGSIVFPHCCSDARKEGHVTPIVTFTGIIFGKSFLRKRFINYWVKGSKKMKPLTFEFQYKRQDKGDRWVRIVSPHYLYLYECFERMQDENSWSQHQIHSSL